MTPDNLRLLAKHFHKIGLNVTCISNQMNEYNFYSNDILKAPNHPWEHLFSSRQTEDELEQYEYEIAVGLGYVTGYDSLLAIDIDGCNDYTILDDFLNALNLPVNYDWTIKSGSNNGFHILVRCDKFEALSEEDAVSVYQVKEDYEHLITKVELLWKTHCVLPPSLHKTSGKYEFVTGRIPQRFPIEIEHEYLNKAIEKYLLSEKVVIGKGYFGASKIYDSNGNVLSKNVVTRELEKIKGVVNSKGKIKKLFLSDSEIEQIDGDELLDFQVQAEQNLPVDTPGNIKFNSDKINKDCICIFDIETDGLPTKDRTPNILQLAWIIMNPDGIILKKESTLIKAENIDKRGLEYNNIDIEQLNLIGINRKAALNKFIADVKVVDYISAHNIEFDLNIISYHIEKNGLQQIPENKHRVCTMIESLNFCQLEADSFMNFKYPKLTELFKCLFDTEINQIHNAESDALITARCLKQLLKAGIISLKNDLDHRIISQSDIQVEITGVFQGDYLEVFQLNSTNSEYDVEEENIWIRLEVKLLFVDHETNPLDLRETIIVSRKRNPKQFNQIYNAYQKEGELGILGIRFDVKFVRVEVSTYYVMEEYFDNDYKPYYEPHIDENGNSETLDELLIILFPNEVRRLKTEIENKLNLINEQRFYGGGFVSSTRGNSN